jgi:hypothetical protein
MKKIEKIKICKKLNVYKLVLLTKTLLFVTEFLLKIILILHGKHHEIFNEEREKLTKLSHRLSIKHIQIMSFSIIGIDVNPFTEIKR